VQLRCLFSALFNPATSHDASDVFGLCRVRGSIVVRAALLFSLSLGERPALAQVNAEVLRPNPLREGWTGGLDGNLALARGNIDLLDVGGGGRVQYQTLHPVVPGHDGVPDALPFIAQRAFLTTSARFAERADTTYMKQAFVHARWTGMWSERLGTDVFAQYQLNEFLRLQGRAVVGTGVRAEVVHQPVLMAWGGSGYMFEYNRISVLQGAPDARQSRDHRWTNYFTARLALFESELLVQNTLYYQPRFDNFGDFRILEELEALSKVTDVFAFGMTLAVLHDSAPPTRVKQTDLRLVSTVRLTF
jgi:Protein of unknown function, DUF481